MSIQDRTLEFQTLTSTASKRLIRVGPSQQQRLLSADKPKSQRGEFARRALDIGRGITDTMGKLERLALLAKRKALFDDKPVEVAELTYVIKQDLSSINASISSLQSFVRNNQSSLPSSSAEHSKNVVVMLQGKLADVSIGFKEVLEVRTKNIQASRARTEKFVSGVRPSSPQPGGLTANHSPLYATPSGTPKPPPPGGDLLSLDPIAVRGGSGGGEMQMQLMEEGGQGSYISARSEAIEAIERTIVELGGIFSQLATMVGEQSEMIQRIDHETEDVVTNIEGGQRELLKYWGRVSSNRWLVVKMFGVMMIFFLLWVLVS